MSLISAKNFVAPLQNKVHLGTIILVAVCFAFLRGSGASIGTYSKSYDNSYKQRSRTSTPNRYSKQRAQQDRLRQEYNKKPRSNTARPTKKNSKSQKNPGSLFDLEKELGLK